MNSVKNGKKRKAGKNVEAKQAEGNPVAVVRRDRQVHVAVPQGFVARKIHWLTDEANVGKLQALMLFNSLALTLIWYWFQSVHSTDPLSYVVSVAG